MSAPNSRSAPKRVLIAGGGIAAVEAALALRALASDRVRLTLISPDAVSSTDRLRRSRRSTTESL
jgi:NADH dehydrogenase FAD-containing subunit